LKGIGARPPTRTIENRTGLGAFDISLTSITSAANFAVSLYVAPIMTAFIPHVFVGAILMTPLNLFLAYTVWAIARKKVFTMYFLVYGLLSMPTTIWGSTPGIFKPVLGLAIGLTLDTIASRLQPCSRGARIAMAILFPVVWWTLTGGMWTLAGLPIVQMFQGMLMAVPALWPIAEKGFIATFTTIAIMTMPSSMVAAYSAVSLSKRIGKIVAIPQTMTIEEENNHGKSE